MVIPDDRPSIGNQPSTPGGIPNEMLGVVIDDEYRVKPAGIFFDNVGLSLAEIEFEGDQNDQDEGQVDCSPLENAPQLDLHLLLMFRVSFHFECLSGFLSTCVALELFGHENESPTWK